MLKSQRVNESASLSAAHLMTPGLWTWTRHITVNQGAALQTHFGKQYTSTLGPVFFLPRSGFVFPSIQSNDMAAVFITLCGPSLAACLVFLPALNKAAITALNQQNVCCTSYETEQGEKKGM